MALESFQISELKKATNRAKSFLCMREQQSADRSSLDPRSLKDRTPMHFADIDWQNLALASNGNCSCLLYTSPSPRDLSTSRMPSSA